MEVIKKAGEGADYYAYCDQDDVWEEDKLIAAVNELVKYENSKPVLYYSKVKRYGANLEEIKDPFKKDYHVENFGGVLICPRATGSTMVWNKALMEALQKYIPSCTIWPDAWTINVCAALGGTIIYDSTSHLKYRRHENNVTGKQAQLQYNPMRLFSYRVGKFFNYSYKPVDVAEELMRGFEESIKSENRGIIEKMMRSGAD